MGLYFSISGIAILLVLMYNFFIKERVNNIETRIYKYLLITTSVDLCLDILTAILFYLGLDYDNFFYVTGCKLVFICSILYFFLFAFYIKAISTVDINKKPGTLNKVFSVFVVLFALVMPFVLILPLNFVEVSGVIVPKGIGITLTYIVNFGLTFYSIVVAILHRKDIAKNKLTPLFVFVVLLGVNFLVQSIFPDLYLINFLLTLTVVIMYFTIENPDLKMIKQLDIAKSQAEKANKAKTEFLSNMSHEIRTPLNAIVGFSECMLESKNLDEETKGFAKDIVDASNNLLEIVNGILDISKIEANKMEIINKEYNPREVFNSLCKLTIPRIGDKPIEFNFTISDDIPGVLKGDVAKVKQIILNLLTNAAKYTDKGEINFNVNCINRVDTKTCLLYISVKDTGRGIKKENIEKLFNKFERIDEDRNTTIEGTGLGLAITKNLVEMMGGRINVFSKFNEGSTFRVYLEQEIVSMEVPEGNSEEIEIDYNAHRGKKILVVDDSKINLKVAINVLKPYHMDVVTVESGAEALSLMESKTFDLILMDIMMPKMDGVETLNKLKEIPGFDVPVVALTADAIEGTDEKYKNLGFDDYLSKPIDRYLLSKVLNRLLK